MWHKCELKALPIITNFNFLRLGTVIILQAVCTWQSDLKRQGEQFDYGRAQVRFRMPTRAWGQPKFFPLKEVQYVCSILVLSGGLCYFMRVLSASDKTFAQL